MANLNASKKNIRKIEKQTERNRQVKSRLKTLAKRIQTSATAGDSASSKAVAIEYVACLDKAAKRNIIHSNRADRQKSAVSKFIFAV